MAYDDVPQRLLDGEKVPRSEIIGYASEYGTLFVSLMLHRMSDLGFMQREVIDDVMTYAITPYGHTIRQDFVVRIEGDCPECP